MKEFASPCCGSCNLTILDEYYSCPYKDGIYNYEICDKYKPRNPIKNYEDELLKLILIEITNHDKAGITKKQYEWQKVAIELIEKIINKKWEDIKCKNEV